MKLTISLLLYLCYCTFLSCAQRSHSCKSAEDCQSMSSRWRAYKFVCCTTIACSDPFRYFLVNSGCTSTNACKKVARVTTSMFAARIEAEKWLPQENQLYRDCEATRQKMTSLPVLQSSPPTISPNVPKAVPRKTQFTSSFSGVDAFSKRDTISRSSSNPWRTEGRCGRIESDCRSNGETCCVHIRCNTQRTQGGNLNPEYIVQELCSPNCRVTTARSGSSYLFTFPPSEWEKRSIYEEDYRTGPLTSSCTETRYYYAQLKQEEAQNRRRRIL